jgi:hypothetical protein
MQYRSHARRYGRFPGSLIAGKAHVQRRRLGLQADGAPQLFDKKERGDLPHPALYRHEPDKLAIERVERLAHVRLAVERIKIERRSSRSQHRAFPGRHFRYV